MVSLTRPHVLSCCIKPRLPRKACPRSLLCSLCFQRQGEIAALGNVRESQVDSQDNLIPAPLHGSLATFYVNCPDSFGSQRTPLGSKQIIWYSFQC